MFDTLKSYDEVIIVMTDAETGAIDTLFKGKVIAKSSIQNLDAPHYSGKETTIIFSGMRSGKLVLQIQKIFNGSTSSNKSVEIILTPNANLSSTSTSIKLSLGDSVELPLITVTPIELTNKKIIWSISDSSIITLKSGKVFYQKNGITNLIAKLDFDTSKQLVIKVNAGTITDSNLAALPPVPTIETLSPSNGSVVITWQPITGVSEFNLFYGEGGGVDKNSTRIKKVTSPYEVKALKNGIAYGFALTSVNAQGESGLSAVKTASAQLISIGAPHLDSVSAQNGKVIVSWSGLPDALGYVLYYASASTVDKNNTKITGVTSPFVLAGLTNGTQYSFAISALNSSGETSLSNTISIKPVAPDISVSGFSYDDSSATYWQSVKIITNKVSTSVIIDSFNITPALPSGLILNKTTGEISGTPLVSSVKTAYTITGKTATTQITAKMSITINGSPSGLTYKDNPVIYWQSVQCPTNSATITGLVDTFTVSPTLPSGMTISKTTGAISGTPSVIISSTKYTVTAMNPAGSTTATLSIQVNGAPSGFSYSVNPANYFKGVDIGINAPMVSGAVDSFLISPDLPTGLALNKTTGVISGTPTVTSNSATYTVVAKNASGSRSVTLTLKVNGSPTGLSYTLTQANYVKGTTILENSATISGPVDSFSISPALPTGLALNKITGSISGTPSVLTSAAKYTVTAKNVAGTTTVDLTLAVVSLPLGTLTYSTNPVIYTMNAAIAPNVPTVTGGANDFSVSPALPSGLILNQSTGIISGTPTAISGSAVFVITAKNPSGSSTTCNLNIAVKTNQTTITIPVTKDIALDTSSGTAWDVGATGYGYIAKWPGRSYYNIIQFDVSTASSIGISSAKLQFKTYVSSDSAPITDGKPRTLKAHVYCVNSAWVEGTGNWFFIGGNWANGGDIIYANYGISDATKTKSTNPSTPTGLLYSNHDIVRLQNLTLVEPVQDIVVTYGTGSLQTTTTSALPSATNLVTLEVDVTNYIKSRAGTGNEKGIVVMLEGIPEKNEIGTLFKEMGDGSYGPKLIINY